MLMHKHHIIPKHAGGTNDPSNIVLLTVEEHAEAHRKLFEQYGRWQDELAWKTLTKRITIEEALREAARLYMTGRTVSDETKRKISEANKGKRLSEETKRKIGLKSRGNKWINSVDESMRESALADWKGKISATKKLRPTRSMLGKTHTEETKQKIANAKRGHTYNRGRVHTIESKLNMSESHKGSIPWNLGKTEPKVMCPHCEIVGGRNAMKRYHFDNCKAKS